MRLEISRKTDLALRAVRVLAGAEDRTKGADLAAAIGTSTAFLAQVMTPLVRQGWVDSEPGRTGGYSLAVDAEEISVLALIEAVEGPTDTETCVLQGGACFTTERCALHDAWVAARTALMKTLDTTSVTEIPAQEESP